jgi:hypothetical protein
MSSHFAHSLSQLSNWSPLGKKSHSLVMNCFIFPRTCDNCIDPSTPFRFNFTPIHRFFYKSEMCLFEVKLTLQLISACCHLVKSFLFLNPYFNRCFNVSPFFQMCLFHKSKCVYFIKLIRSYNSILVTRPTGLFGKIIKILT